MAILSGARFFCFVLLGLCVASVKCKNVIFTDENWKDMLQGQWIVKFYAPWCPACRALDGTWNELADWAETQSISVGSVDVTKQPALNGRFMITSLPTIYHVTNGEFRSYTSGRSLTDFKEFITEEKWRGVSPGSSWMSPNSLVMSGISKLFGLSTSLKAAHESLNSDYGLPGWVSFLLFGLVIIAIGLLLGILLVLATDWIWGSPSYADSSYEQHKKNDDVLEDEGANETKKENQDTKTNSEEEESEENVRHRNVTNADEEK